MFKINSCKDPVTVSHILKRLGIRHKHVLQQWRWDDYNTASHKAWITSKYRIIGVSTETPDVRMSENETLIAVSLPWTGCGRDLAMLVQTSRGRARAARSSSARSQARRVVSRRRRFGAARR